MEIESEAAKEKEKLENEEEKLELFQEEHDKLKHELSELEERKKAKIEIISEYAKDRLEREKEMEAERSTFDKITDTFDNLWETTAEIKEKKKEFENLHMNESEAKKELEEIKEEIRIKKSQLIEKESQIRFQKSTVSQHKKRVETAEKREYEKLNAERLKKEEEERAIKLKNEKQAREEYERLEVERQRQEKLKDLQYRQERIRQGLDPETYGEKAAKYLKSGANAIYDNVAFGANKTYEGAKWVKDTVFDTSHAVGHVATNFIEGAGNTVSGSATLAKGFNQATDAFGDIADENATWEQVGKKFKESGDSLWKGVRRTTGGVLQTSAGLAGLTAIVGGSGWLLKKAGNTKLWQKWQNRSKAKEKKSITDFAKEILTEDAAEHFEKTQLPKAQNFKNWVDEKKDAVVEGLTNTSKAVADEAFNVGKNVVTGAIDATKNSYGILKENLTMQIEAATDKIKNINAQTVALRKEEKEFQKKLMEEEAKEAKKDRELERADILSGEAKKREEEKRKILEEKEKLEELKIKNERELKEQEELKKKLEEDKKAMQEEKKKISEQEKELENLRKEAEKVQQLENQKINENKTKTEPIVSESLTEKAIQQEMNQQQHYNSKKDLPLTNLLNQMQENQNKIEEENEKIDNMKTKIIKKNNEIQKDLNSWVKRKPGIFLNTDTSKVGPHVFGKITHKNNIK